ncbi:MAG TPA: crosslink repair DNA glycosylase YcaQ family protein [Mycobacteriales bacterium]|nr:crosslink repair DNA glycosylase YcaQ family protein [Mycobacteriales bacterium]
MPRPERLSPAAARRVALAAQGFNDTPVTGAATRRHLRRVLSRTQLLQIDSVNVFERAHYLPAFSRLGPYPRRLVDDAAYRHREVFEYWGHEASLLPVELHPLLRWRMEQAARGEAGWGRTRRIAVERPDLVAHVLQRVADEGPIGAGALHAGERRGGPWWGWTETKVALEHLFWSGRVSTAVRTRQFERLYDLTERVLPAEVLAAPTPDEAEAHRGLVERSARAHGVATESDLRDYFRLSVAPTRIAVRELVDDGVLLPVAVEGWRQPAWLHRDAAVPRRVRASALLSPFDPLVWERARTQRLFGFTYRIEIYVPAPLRVHGYYVLPFLHDEALRARVDLKADRPAGALLVQAAHLEPGQDAADTAAALAAQLRQAAAWQGLADVVVRPRGDLAPALAVAL